MPRLLRLLAMAAAALLVGSAAAEEQVQPALPPLRIRLDGMSGCMVLYDSWTDQQLEYNPERCAERFPPCSTFKIPHTLAALDSGVVTGPDFSLSFDPARDAASSARAGSDQGTYDLRGALRDSIVWYFQEVARRLGPEREQHYLDQFDYGNRDPSSGLTDFWLGGYGEHQPGSLRISAREQVAFLRRFHTGRLGIGAEHTQLLRELLRLESADGWTLYGKTGLGELEDGNKLGWLVGWVEREGQVVCFGLNIEHSGWDAVMAPRLGIAKAMLADCGYWPPAPPDPNAP